jgi:hypothetical protein
VNELKRSRDWNSYNIAGDLEWIGFGEQESTQKDRPLTPDDLLQPGWKDAKPAVVTDLQGTFTVTSGITFARFVSFGF